MRNYLYYKNGKRVVPSEDKVINLKAKKKLYEIYKNKAKLNIPKKFIENWSSVSLYNPKGDVERASGLLLNVDDGAYDINNRLNHLTGKEWVKFSCSWFIFNALHSDLKVEKELDPHISEHPATFSPTMISDFIKFFTKEGDRVLDPFAGIGSTLEACKRTHRIGYGIELNEKYFSLCIKRTPEFEKNIYHTDASNITQLDLPKMDFSISSPPYWNILNRSTHTFRKDRLKRKLDVSYSEEEKDLGNIDDYEQFLDKLSEIYLGVYEVLRKGAYLVVIIKNVKKEGKMYPLAWDLARKLSKKFILKDERIWIQDKISLAPYGYPFSWASNIIHHYCLILQK